MQKKSSRTLLVLTLLAAASLACGLFSGLNRQLGQIRSTAQSAATGIEEGRNLVETGQALATQVLGNDIVQTARAFATEQGPGLLATGEAFATERGPALAATLEALATEKGPAAAATLEALATQYGPSLAGTAQAFATQEGPGLLATGQAFATEQGPALAATVQALATQAASGTRVPNDIPQVEGEKNVLVDTSNFLSYTTALDLRTVEDFYEREMPANGWTKIEQGSVVSAASAIFIYEKSGRRATVTISADTGAGGTLVAIVIQ